MFAAFVVPTLPTEGDVVILTARLQEFGMGESTAAEKLGDLMERDRNPLVGTTASDSIVSARIRVQGESGWAATQLDATIQRIRDAWKPYVFAEGDESLASSVGTLLQERGLRLATAESCTGGWLGKTIVDRAGSSAYYLGGWVTYSNELKTELLGVPAELIAQHGAVSAEVAIAMTEGALKNSSAECALSITGIAGPEGGSAEKPVGTVFIALAKSDGDSDVRRFEFPGERHTVRDRSVKAALQMLRFALLGESDSPMIWESTRPASS
jgi:nicotinamide-nucleotide amidase